MTPQSTFQYIFKMPELKIYFGLPSGNRKKLEKNADIKDPRRKRVQWRKGNLPSRVFWSSRTCAISRAFSSWSSDSSLGKGCAGRGVRPPVSIELPWDSASSIHDYLIFQSIIPHKVIQKLLNLFSENDISPLILDSNSPSLPWL